MFLALLVFRAVQHISHITNRQALRSAMSNLFGKAEQKFKAKVGQVADRLRLGSRDSRVTAPAPSPHSVQPIGTESGIGTSNSAQAAGSAMTESSIASISLAVQPTHVAGPAMDVTPSPPVGATSPRIKNPTEFPSAPTLVDATGSVVKGLSIVNQSGNTTYNFGRDVLNNNYITNNVNVQIQMQVQCSELTRHEPATNQSTGGCLEDDPVRWAKSRYSMLRC